MQVEQGLPQINRGLMKWEVSRIDKRVGLWNKPPYDLYSVVIGFYNSFYAQYSTDDGRLMVWGDPSWKLILLDWDGLTLEEATADVQDVVLRRLQDQELMAEHKKRKIDTLLAQRQEARAKKDFALSDKIRDQLTSLGVEVKDQPIKKSGVVSPR